MGAVEQLDINSSGCTVSERDDLGLIVAEPNRADIIGRAAGYPAVLRITRGTGLAHQLELAEILARTEASRGNGLEQLAHNLCGILAEHLLRLGLSLKQNLGARGVCDLIVAIGLIVIAVVAEDGICRSHFDRCDTVSKRARGKRRDAGIVGIVKSRQMERLFHEVISFVDAEHLGNYSDGNGVERLLYGVLDGDIFL